MFRVELRQVPVEPQPETPPGHAFARRALGREAGAVLTGCSVYELPPGEAGFAYHYELLREEWLLVVEGQPTLTTPDGEQRLRPGDVACFPTGPAGAHSLRNDGDGPTRFVLFSNLAETYPTVQPRSGKLMVSDGDRRRVVRLEPDVPYWEGEA